MVFRHVPVLLAAACCAVLPAFVCLGMQKWQTWRISQQNGVENPMV
jgi:hypothetical protein